MQLTAQRRSTADTDARGASLWGAPSSFSLAATQNSCAYLNRLLTGASSHFIRRNRSCKKVSLGQFQLWRQGLSIVSIYLSCEAPGVYGYFSWFVIRIPLTFVIGFVIRIS